MWNSDRTTEIPFRNLSGIARPYDTFRKGMGGSHNDASLLGYNRHPLCEASASLIEKSEEYFSEGLAWRTRKMRKLLYGQEQS